MLEIIVRLFLCVDTFCSCTTVTLSVIRASDMVPCVGQCVHYVINILLIKPPKVSMLKENTYDPASV